jgi:hypothetical protein
MRVFVGINPKVTEMASFTTKWNMVIDPHRCGSRRWTVKHRFNAGHIILIPKRKRWVIRNKIVTGLGFCFGFLVRLYNWIFAHFFPFVSKA